MYLQLTKVNRKTEGKFSDGIYHETTQTVFEPASVNMSHVVRMRPDRYHCDGELIEGTSLTFRNYDSAFTVRERLQEINEAMGSTPVVQVKSHWSSDL